MADKADKNFTPREMEIMAKAWNCMVEEPKVDYENLAKACGMSHPRSASNAWRAIRTKIVVKGGIAKISGNKDGNANGDDVETPVKATPRKRGKAKVDADCDDESPTKKVKGGAKGGKKSEVVVEEAEEGGKPVKGGACGGGRYCF